MRKIKLTIERVHLAENNHSENEKVFRKFSDLFENNRTIQNAEIIRQLEPEHCLVKQKAKFIPVHLQEDVGRELQKLIKAGNLEITNNVDEDCFISPIVITVKNVESVKLHYIPGT